MVMHPNFEDLPTHPNASAKPLYLIIKIPPLKLPTKLLRKPQHLLLLIFRELRPEPLLAVAAPILRGRAFSRRQVLHFPVEVAVAAARRALQSPRAVHRELAAPVRGVASEAGCMVSQALSVYTYTVPLLSLATTRSSFHSFSFQITKLHIYIYITKPFNLHFAMTTLVILGYHIYNHIYAFLSYLNIYLPTISK